MLQADRDERVQSEPIGAEQGARNSFAAFDSGYSCSAGDWFRLCSNALAEGRLHLLPSIPKLRLGNRLNGNSVALQELTEAFCWPGGSLNA